MGNDCQKPTISEKDNKQQIRPNNQIYLRKRNMNLSNIQQQKNNQQKNFYKEKQKQKQRATSQMCNQNQSLSQSIHIRSKSQAQEQNQNNQHNKQNKIQEEENQQYVIIKPIKKILTEKQLTLTNIQLLQKQNKCKIKEKKGKYPRAFRLITIPAKNQQINNLSQQKKLKEILSLNLSVLSYSIRELIDFSTQILWNNSYTRQLYKKSQVNQLIKLIACNYNLISYHNFSHAFSLVQLNMQALQMMKQFKSKLSQAQLFCIIVAGLAHDMNHYGTNNMFEIKRSSKLAKFYNNQSILEKMHVSCFWKILADYPELDFLSKKTNQKINSKEMITQLILNTDMTNHFKNLQILKKRNSQNNSFQLTKKEDRMFLIEQLFHSCDLGNPTLQFDQYISWAGLLTHQFNQQAKLQKQYKIQVTKGFKFINVQTFYNDQIGFVDAIVYPLWHQLAFQLPQLKYFQKNIQENVKILKKKLNQQLEKKGHSSSLEVIQI